MASQELTTTPAIMALSVTTDEMRRVIQSAIGNESLSVSDLVRVKLPAAGSTTWTVATVDGDVDTKVIRGVVVTHRQVRVYWKDAYTGDNTPPDCFSDDTIHGIGDPGGACEKCEFAQFGTARGGTARGQACQLRRLLFFLPEDQYLPMLINLPVTSQGVAKQYFVKLASAGVSIHDVLTSFELVKVKGDGVPDYSQVVMKRVGMLPEQMRQRMQAYVEVMQPALNRLRTTGYELADTIEDSDDGIMRRAQHTDEEL